jgi:hypothetical protein
VLARIGLVAYRLALPPKCRIYAIFHVVFLKKFMGTQPTVVPHLPPIKHGRVMPQPEKVLRARLNRGVWEILVQWLCQATADVTWENVPEFKDAYPSFQLENELFLNGGVMWMFSLGENISDYPERGPDHPIGTTHSPAGTTHIPAGPSGRREIAHNNLRKLIFKF